MKEQKRTKNTGKFRALWPLATAALLLHTSSAFGLPITFTVSAMSSETTPRPQNGWVMFSASGSTLTMQLKNTGGPGQIGGISSVLDGIAFTFASSVPSISLASATSLGGTMNCTSGTCIPNTTPYNPTAWAVQTSTFPATTVVFGPTGWKPYGIVNSNVTPTDGIPNVPHNPYLVSDDGTGTNPVTFTFNLGGVTAVPGITGVNFYFGTGPDIRSGSTPSGSRVPIPSTLLLLGIGLVGLGWAQRKSTKR